MPVSGDVFNPFSGDALVYSQTFGDFRVHQGADIKAEKGGEVRAITDGKVLSVTEDSMLGTVVEIQHDGGLTAYYCGLSKQPTVKKGDKVKVSQVIGSVFETPCEIADQPHAFCH